MPSGWHGRNRVETARSPISVCAPFLFLSPSLCVCACVSLCPSRSVPVSVFLHVLIVTRRSSRARARACWAAIEGRAAAGVRSWMLGTGPDTTRAGATDTNCARRFFPVPGPLVGMGKLRKPPRRGGGDWRRNESRLEARLSGVEFFACF